MKLTKQRLKEIIKEEIEESLNPEWDKASEIQSAMTDLADILVARESATAGQLAHAIVKDLHSTVVAMEARLNKKFAASVPEDEDPDVEPLVLPKVTPGGLERMRRIARRGPGDD